MLTHYTSRASKRVASILNKVSLTSSHNTSRVHKASPQLETKEEKGRKGSAKNKSRVSKSVALASKQQQQQQLTLDKTDLADALAPSSG